MTGKLGFSEFHEIVNVIEGNNLIIDYRGKIYI